MELDDYVVVTRPRRVGDAEVYRGERRSDGLPVWVKCFPPNAAEAATRARREYALLRAVRDGAAPATVELREGGERPVLVTEQITGRTLAPLLRAGPMAVDRFLDLAMAIARAVRSLHAAQVLHGMLEPHTLCLRPAGTACALEFDAAQPLGEAPDAHLPSATANPAYLAPELCANELPSSLDARSDLYSLGAIFYEMLVGHPPFAGDDRETLLRAHRERSARPPHLTRSEVPEVLSRLVRRLIEKRPEDRYPSAEILLADLERCAEQWAASGTLDPDLELGRSGERLEIPDRMVGRERELQALSSIRSRVRGGSVELLVIGGPAGVGKTALVGSLEQGESDLPTLFTRASFESRGHESPYAAIHRVLGSLVEQLLALPAPERAEWKQAIAEKLGSVAGALSEAVPRLSLLVGEAAPLRPLPPSETGHRLSLAVTRMLSAIATLQHPLVVVLDDIQWADAATRQMLQDVLLSGECEALLLAVTCSSDALEPGAPLTQWLERMRGASLPITQLTLDNLTDSDTTGIVAATLGETAASVQSLASYLSRRTGNNPLLLRQFLISLHDMGLLHKQDGRYRWDENAVRTAQIPDGIVQILTPKLERLDENPRQLLELASILGDSFDAEMLASLWDGTRESIQESLDTLCREGLLLRGSRGYRFAHERVRRTAYGLWDEEQLPLVHRRVAQALLEGWDGTDQGPRLFQLADHLDRARDVLSEADRTRAIDIQYAAGDAVLRSGALSEAEQFFGSARWHVREHDWERNPDLMYSLYLRSAQIASVSGHVADAEILFGELDSRIRNPLRRAEIATHRVTLYRFVGDDPAEAVSIGIAALREFGLRIPACPSRLRLLRARLRASWLFRRKGPEGFTRTSDSDSPEWLAQLSVLGALFPASWRTGANLGTLLGYLVAIGTLRRGGIGVPVIVVVAYASAEVRSGRMQQARALLDLAMELADDNTSLHTWLRLRGIEAWLTSRREALSAFVQIAAKMSEAGSLQESFQAQTLIGWLQPLLGYPLSTCEESLRGIAELALRYEYQESIDPVGALRALSLLTNSEIPLDLALQSRQGGSGQTVVAVFEIAALYILGRPDEALEKAAEVESWFLPYGTSWLWAPDFYLYRALAAACAQEYAGRRRRALRSLIRQSHHYFERLARTAPDNFEHMRLLVAAEMARHRGESSRASVLYARACELAQAHGYLQHAAIGFEARGLLALDMDNGTDAQVFLHSACALYSEWGSRVKVEQMHALYGEMLADPETPEERSKSRNTTRPESTHAASTASRSSTSLGATKTLDLSTVMRSSEAISGEVELDRVLERVMTIAIENAGAQRAVLLLDHDGDLRIEAESSAGHCSPPLHGSASVAASGDVLAANVVQYVQRTRKLVVLGHASVHGLFVEDPYIASRGSKSILCLPIIRQSRLVGVLYLENDLVTNAFTEGRVEVLSLLSSHAAISIDNSTLYRNITELNRDLEARVEMRTLQVREARDAAEAATRAKSEFLAVMSHEIRTPMNVVIGNAQLLMDMDLNAEQKECVQAVHTAGDSLLTVINDILDFSKIEAGHLELEFVPFDLVHCIEEVGAILAPRAQAKGIEFPIVIDHDVPKQIVGDPARLKQVIINFVNNAIKFTDRGEVEISVHVIESREAEDSLRISVRDTGIGIPADRLGRLFQSFSQIDASTTRKYGGTGLGLAISKRLVEAMGGRVGVRSEEGAGSVFSCDITFPVDRTAELDADPSFGRIHAFVVVPHERNGEGVCERLRRFGSHSRWCEHPENLPDLSALPEDAMPVVLLRHPCPEEWKEVLRECEYPVHLMSTLSERSEADAAAHDLGCAGLLTWPVRLAQLRVMMFRMLGRAYQEASQKRVDLSEEQRAARSGVKILLAEDYELNQRLAVRLLERAGYPSETEDNGRRVVERVQSGEYDLVLLDIQMPEMDGFEATRAIRAWEAEHGGHTPIIAVTANAMQGDRERCLEAGMDDYLAKPIRVEALYELLAKYLSV